MANAVLVMVRCAPVRPRSWHELHEQSCTTLRTSCLKWPIWCSSWCAAPLWGREAGARCTGKHATPCLGLSGSTRRDISGTRYEPLGGRAQGNRESIDAMAGGSAQVLQQVLRLIDAHDLYGSVAYPKKHTQKDISDIYLLPFATRGVFTNVALQEPFGLTVIEVRSSRRPS